MFTSRIKVLTVDKPIPTLKLSFYFLDGLTDLTQVRLRKHSVIALN
jgi:hypothetical protein